MNPDHAAIVLSGRKALVNWLKDNSRSLSLAGLDLRGYNFSKLKLSGADFTGARLQGARFENAELFNAKLQGAELEDSNLTHANLSHADLSFTNLRNADLTDADLSYANLTNADLSYAKLTRTRFNYSTLCQANFHRSFIRDAHFRRCQCDQASFSYARFWNVVIQKSNLTQAVGLADIDHIGKSRIDLYTLYNSPALPGSFLDACDIPQFLRYSEFDDFDDNILNALGHVADHDDYTSDDLDLDDYDPDASINELLGESKDFDLDDYDPDASINELGGSKDFDLDDYDPDVSINELGGSKDFVLDDYDPNALINELLGGSEFVYFVDETSGATKGGLQVGHDEEQIVRQPTPSAFHSCVISFSFADILFAQKLYTRMMQNKLRVWYAPDSLQGGKRLHEQVADAIKNHDKLLVILSSSSIRSEWVKTEIAEALKKEKQQNANALFPLRLVPFELIESWTEFNTDLVKDIASVTREYFIPSFENWKDDSEFDSSFEKLLVALKR